MSMRWIFVFLIALLSVCPVSSAVQKRDSGRNKDQIVRSEIGLNIPEWGISIDALYDPRLDNLIPGFKILNVVVTNRTQNVITLDPKKDNWVVQDHVGKKFKAINHLKLENEKLWVNLPGGLREKLEYPHAIRTGHTGQIDLFFPAHVDLHSFRQIGWRSTHFNKEFSVLSTLENKLELENDLDPLVEKKTYKRSLEKYEEEEPKPTEENIPSAMQPELDDFSIPMN